MKDHCDAGPPSPSAERMRHHLDKFGPRHGDLPRKALIMAGNDALRKFADQKPEIHFKFTCERCGERCMLSDANKLYERGTCHVCGHETPIKRGGFCVLFNLKQ
jgi:hypothetical protein